MSTSNLMTYLLQSPVYLLGFFAILGFGWSAGRFKENVWHIVSCAMARLMSGGAFGVIDGGNSYDDYTLNVGARYSGVCLLVIGTASALNLHVSWETSLVPAPRHKVCL